MSKRKRTNASKSPFLLDPSVEFALSADLLMKLLTPLSLACLIALTPAAQTISNPTRHDWNQALVRLSETPPGPVQVLRDGTPVPHQVNPLTRELWVAVDLESGASAGYEVRPGPAPATPQGFVVREGDHWVLRNRNVFVRVPAAWTPGQPAPAPLQGFRTDGGSWRGRGEWHSAPALRGFRSEPVGAGPLFAAVRLQYDFEDGHTAEVTVTLPPERPFAQIQSRHSMREGDGWGFDLAAGWSPAEGVLRRWHSGPFRGAPAQERFPLVPGFTRLGSTLLRLLPRWTQSYDEGWTMGIRNDEAYAGVLVLRASEWLWPHDNPISMQVREQGDQAVLRFPTYRGGRVWLLVAGEAALADQIPRIALDENVLRPDKLVHQYRLPFAPGERNLIGGANFFDGGTNPTGMMRQQNRQRVNQAQEGRTTRSLNDLYMAQALFDKDWYGCLDSHWSPLNPNFYTDFIRGAIALTVQLREHPEFPHLRRLAEEAFRRDVDYAVTLPGGAGQECPGYQEHAQSAWLAMAPLAAEHLGFDPMTWPRVTEGARFLARISPPNGPGRRTFHPIGDTHPNRPEPLEYARRFGIRENPSDWVSEEFPGFGVIFRNRSGTPRETFLSFKSGPNRGHYHGDQLSLHLCWNARPVAVDHHASYNPRPGQEHMHNRLSFSHPDMPWGNMDGHERLIAFRTSPRADVAVGQVESPRLREAKRLPPEDWDVREPTIPFDVPLRYRRTVVFLKGEMDVIVLLDEFEGPELTATWNLHVRGTRAERADRWISFNGLEAFVAHPERFEFDTLPWEHENGGREVTNAGRVSVTGRSGTFITLLAPSRIPAGPVENGIRFQIPGEPEEILTFSENGSVRLLRGGETLDLLRADDIDLDRSQGEIGLFVPDVGYPFGPLPDWLIRQRAQALRP